MDATSRFGLPLLVAGQGQKEVTHNEALMLIDAMIGCIVERRDQAEPPPSAEAGLCWVVPPGAIGEWAGRDGQIAISTAGGWRYGVPAEGTALFVRAGRERLRRIGSGWVPDVGTGSPSAPVADPTGGQVIDSEARAALVAILDRLRAMGLVAVP